MCSWQIFKFVAENYKSLPPSTGFEPIAIVLASLRDEISALRAEREQDRSDTQRDMKALNDVSCVQQDRSDIKSVIYN